MPTLKREAAIESSFCTKVRASGGEAFKLATPGQRGAPDRLLVLPWGRIVFVEFKRPGKIPTPLQEIYHAKLRKLQATVYVVDSDAAAARVLRDLGIV